VAVLVVDLALVGVREHLVGLGELLEALLGLRVVRVGVRVRLAGEAAEGLLDLGLVGLAADAEDLVVVALHRSHTSSTKRESSPGGRLARCRSPSGSPSGSAR
jgi:hypothetical protein